MQIQEKMCKRIISIDVKKSSFEAALKMREYDIGFLPVTERNKVIGILTDRDLVVRGMANHMDSNLKNVMTKKIITIEFDKDITVALQLMTEKKVKRLLVTDQNKIVGILSLSDILDAKDRDEIFETISSIYKITRNEDIKDPEIDEFYL